MYICIVIFGFCVFISTLCIMFMSSFFTLCFSSCILHIMFMCLCTFNFSKILQQLSTILIFQQLQFFNCKFWELSLQGESLIFSFEFVAILFFALSCLGWGRGGWFVVCKIQVSIHLQFTSFR